MPIKVCWAENGPFAWCETPAEAAELLRLGAALERSSARDNAKTPVDKTNESMALTEDQAMDRFLSELKPNQRNFLAALAQHPEGIKGDALSQELGIEGRQFGPLVSSISKNAGRNEIRIKQLMLSELRSKGSRRYRWFQAKPQLLRYAARIGAQQELRLAG